MIIFRYLCKQFYASLLVLSLVLLTVFMTNQFAVQYLKAVVRGQLTMMGAVQVMFLQGPLVLGYLLPLACFLAILLVLGRLYMDREMTIFSACGLSREQLLGKVLIFSFFVMLVSAALSLWIQPMVEKYRSMILSNAIAEAAIQNIIPKQFRSLGKVGIFYTGKKSQDNQVMKNVFFAVKKKDDWQVTVANSAYEKTEGGQRFLVFKQGSRYVGDPGEKDYEVTHFKRLGMNLSGMTGSPKKFLWGTPTSKLWSERHSNLAAVAELQWRIAMPLSILVLTLLAFPLSRVNPRRGKFARIFPAIVIYAAYANLLFVGRTWIERKIVSPQLGLWWVHGLFLCLAIVLFWWEPIWRSFLSLFRRRHAHS